MKRNKGFTLIELLVVIAIIGILSSIVLASLNSARQKGADAKIVAQLSNMRAQAELYFNSQDPNSYGTPSANCAGGIFTAVGGLQSLLADIVSPACNSVDSAGGTTEATAWSVSAPLVSDPTITFCTDGSGFAGQGKLSDATTGLCI